MDWDKVLTLLHVAVRAQDFPKLHPLRDAAVAELEAELQALQPKEEEA